MATVAPQSTPSKKVAAAIAKMDVNSPIKKSSVDASADDDSSSFNDASFLAKEHVVSDEKSKVSAAEQKVKIDVPTEHPLDNMVANRYAGEVDLPENEEPLLVESSRRFVLFPIRYHEVSLRIHRSIARAHARPRRVPSTRWRC